MANYDYIGTPVSGQPVSKSQFGDKVIEAINDLDRRVSAYDGSSGSATISSASNLVLTTTSETILLTIPSFTFRAGFAYRASIRFGIQTATSGTVCNLRLRKGTSLGTLSGSPLTSTVADYGEYFRYEGKGAVGVMGAVGSLMLLRTATTDLTTGVMLSGQSSIAQANAVTLWAGASSPRYLVIEPAGFASVYAGLGVAVT